MALSRCETSLQTQPDGVNRTSNSVRAVLYITFNCSLGHGNLPYLSFWAFAYLGFLYTLTSFPLISSVFLFTYQFHPSFLPSLRLAVDIYVSAQRSSSRIGIALPSATYCHSMLTHATGTTNLASTLCVSLRLPLLEPVF